MDEVGVDQDKLVEVKLDDLKIGDSFLTDIPGRRGYFEFVIIDASYLLGHLSKTMSQVLRENTYKWAIGKYDMSVHPIGEGNLFFYK